MDDDDHAPTWQPAPALVIQISTEEPDHRPDLTDVTFSPDGSILATASGDYFCEVEDLAVRLWDTTTGALLVAINGLNPDPRRITFSPDGSEIAGVFGDKLAVWTPGHLKPGVPARTCWHASSPTERLRVTSFRAGEALPAWWLPPESSPYLNPGVVPVTADTNIYAAVPSYYYEPSLLDVAWSPDGHVLAAAGTDGAVHCWSATDGRALHTLDGHHNTVLAVAWSPDSARLVSGSFDGTARVWDATRGTCLQVLDGHTGRVDRVAWSGDGQLIASAGRDGVRLWRPDGTLVQVLAAERRRLGDLAFSPDSNCLASSDHDGAAVQIWDVRTGSCRSRLAVDVLVSTLAWSPDGRFLACGSTHGLVWLWPVAIPAEVGRDAPST